MRPLGECKKAAMLIGEDGGQFMLNTTGNDVLCIIASWGGGWDHVSVHVRNKAGGKMRTPTWDEMCIVKDYFFYPYEVAMQLHPDKKHYVNKHEHVLHLWRPQNTSIPLPPLHMV